MKVIVIGAGLVVIQTAYFLHREGHEVCVVEKREGPALETSRANGGLVTPSHAAPWNSPGIWKTLALGLGRSESAFFVKPSALHHYLSWGMKFIRNSSNSRFKRTIARNARLAQYSTMKFREICDDLNLVFDRGQQGSMFVYRKKSSMAEAYKALSVAADHGVEIEKCSTADLLEKEPALSSVEDKLVGGYYFKNDEHGDAYMYVAALEKYLSQNGVEFRYGETVESFDREKDRIKAVRTNVDRLRADAFVIATGPWSAHLTNLLGVNAPVKPVKGYSITFNTSSWAGRPKVPVVDDDLHLGMTPLGSTLRFVGTAEFSGFDDRLNRVRLDSIVKAGLTVYPELKKHIEGQDPLLELNGFRPMTPDCLPIIHRCGCDNVILNSGHSYLGWTTGTGTAKAVADLISGKEASIDLSHFSMARF